MSVKSWRIQVLIGIFAVLILCVGQVGQGQAAWPPKSFPITFWCGPPEPFITVEQYRRIAEAGFTVVMPPCEGAATVERNRKILDIAKATGLKAILADSRMPLALKGHPEAEQALKAIVADYHKHPALLGYFVTDEPGADAFEGLSDVQNMLHKLDPDHLVYINLLPNYASTNLVAKPSQLQTNTYEAYLQQYLRVVKPDVLSWDHYHFLKTGDRPGFYGNLSAAQQAILNSAETTPFWQIVLSVEHGGYRPLTENELRFEAMQSLVYGVHGLVYFTYWLPNDPSFSWNHAIMNRDGTPGPLYEPVKKVNAEVQKLGKWLYRTRVIETFQTGETPPDGREQTGDGGVKMVGPANLSVGRFRGEGYIYVMAANRDYRNGTVARMTLSVGKNSSVLQRLDPVANRWQPIKETKDRNGVITVEFPLDPSAAALFRWE